MATDTETPEHTHANTGEGKTTHSHAVSGSGKGHSHDGMLPYPDSLKAAELDAAARKNLDKSQYAIPEKAPDSGSYPIPDESHARDALARSKGKSEEGRVRAAVKRKFPDMNVEAAEDAGIQHRHPKINGQGTVLHSHPDPVEGHSHESTGLGPMQAGDADDEPMSMFSEKTSLFSIDTGAKVELGEGKPIPFLTTGQWQFDEYGDFQVTRDDLQTIKDNFDEGVRRQELPIINEDHDPRRRAIGWIKQLEFDGADNLVAIPDWTPFGESLVTDGAYKYVSPEANYKTLLLRNWSDPEYREVLHPIVASGLAVTNFPKIKKLGAISANESGHDCELLAFAERSGSDAKTPADMAVAMLSFADPDNDGDDDGPSPPCVFQPPFGVCPGYTRQPGDTDGDGTCLMAERGCNGYIAVGNSSATGPYALSWAERLGKLTTTGANPMPDSTPPAATEPVVAPAPEASAVAAVADPPVVAASEPKADAKSDDKTAELRELLMAEQAKAVSLAERFDESEKRNIALAEAMAELKREKLVNGIRAEFAELLREGKVTPAEMKTLLPDDDHAIKLSENRFVIDTFKSRAKNSAIHLGEVGTAGDETSTDPVDQLTALAAKIREGDPKLTKEMAFAEAVVQHPELYTEFANTHNQHARVIGA